MSLLALKLFLTRYYDLVFLFGLIFSYLSFRVLIRFSNKFKENAMFNVNFNSSNHKAIYFVLTCLLLFGFLVRLYKINSPISDWHSFRQADTASVTRIYLENGLDMLRPRYHDISRVQSGLFNPHGYRFVEFPIYNLFHFLFAKYIPIYSLEVWGRLISVIASLVSAYFIFLIGKRFISGFAGIVAVTFYLFNPFNIYFTRVILPEPLAVCFGLSALVSYIKFHDSNRYSYLYVSAILFAISILIKPFTLFYGIAFIGLALEKFPFRKIIGDWKFIFFTFIVVLPFVVWRAWMQNFPEGIPFWRWTLNGDAIRFKPAFWYWLFGERLAKLILGYWGLIPFSTGLIIYSKKSKIIHLFILGMLFYAITFATANVRHDYYQSIMIPAISLIFALGFTKLWNSSDINKKLSRALLIFTTFLMIITGAFQVKEYYKINHPEIIVAGEATARLTPGNSLVIAPYNGDTAFLYQTKRRGWPVVELPIQELISEGAEYYVSVNFDSQTQEFMRKFEIIEKTDSYVVLDLKQKI